MSKSRVTIVGLGLIGGSIGLALKQSKLELEIIGHDKDLGVAGRAAKRGAVDKTDWNLINACDGASLIVLALPLDAIKDTLAALNPHVPAGTIITDTATSKMPVMEWAKDLPTGVHFIGGNPVIKPGRAANASGIDAAEATLFQGATYCLTPQANAAQQAIDTISGFLDLLGAKPYFMDAAEHDGLMAGVQHLPALLAMAFASVIIENPGWRERAKLAGADFRTATELVPDNEKTAREQFLAHRTDLVRWIDALTGKLSELRELCAREDAASIEALVRTIAVERDRWLNGKLDDADAAPVDWQSVQNNTARIFLGGLVDRGNKRKQ
jgi:prephenate dehydrogenase